jgi:Na+-translocating ferredoxin:NAD+ oxidoreductase RnfD subunit
MDRITAWTAAPRSVAGRAGPRRRDPRPAQIVVLGSLLAYGGLVLDFEVTATRTAAIVAAALATQLLCSRLWKLPRFDPTSALISGLSLSLLLRTNDLRLAVVAAAVAIASKFLIRRGGKHLFNPTCFAIVAMLAATQGARQLTGAPVGVWVSAGQWGSTAFAAFAVAGLGMWVLHRSARSDITWAFLGSYAALVCGRSLWLGEPLAIPLHGLQNGALLVFAFFMISDPKTIPDSRAGRLLFAAIVAAGALFVQFGLYRNNGLLWSLAAAAPWVPLLDRFLPGPRYAWAPSSNKEHSMHPLTRPLVLAGAVALALLGPAASARAFCGFYVAKADAQLFNQASQVVLVRDGDRTVLTMSNDFQGEPEEFAMVIPVPTFVEREQIHVGDRAAIDHLDAYTSPRLVEYFDGDPCAMPYAAMESPSSANRVLARAESDRRARAAGVTIEARYSVGEYEILILSAEQSDGLAGWLRDGGYRLPRGAEKVLASYIRQGMRFFVAKVNLEEQSRLGFSTLRPLQVAYASPKFMLPIRLGTLNAKGTQELFVYTLTRRGRVETTNYRTVELPTGMELPVFVKGEFGRFYTALFDEQVRKQNMRTVFTEYAWDMNWCDPCAADPLSPEELRSLGVFWPDAAPRRSGSKSLARDVFVTRLHLRYDAAHFPADLVFQETADRSNFQGRYILRHPFRGRATCPAAEGYRRALRERQDREARTLASLTSWSIDEIRDRIEFATDDDAMPDTPWWQDIWGRRDAPEPPSAWWRRLSRR